MKYVSPTTAAILNFARHPKTTAVSLIAGLGAVATMIGTIDSSLSQLAHIHGVPAALQASLSHASDALATIVSVALIFAATGSSLLAKLPATETPSPPDGGTRPPATVTPDCPAPLGITDEKKENLG